MKKNELNHELMDRTSIMMDNIDRHLLSHPALKKNKKVGKMILEAWTNLFDVYQEMGYVLTKKKKNGKKNKKNISGRHKKSKNK